MLPWQLCVATSRVWLTSSVSKSLRSFADLVERALVYLMDKDAEFRAQEKGNASISSKLERQPRAKRVSPADKSGGAP